MKNRLCDEYWDSLSAFIEVYTNSLGHISYPYIKYRNHEMLPVETVKAHIHQFDFDIMYTKWIHYGEAETVSSTDLSVGESMDEMFAVLNDVVGINDDHDILDETKVGIEDTQDDKFKDLLFELQVGLYLGCTKYSSLDFLVKLMHLKVLYNWKNECMDAILKLLKGAFPNGNKLPTSHYKSKKLLSKLGLSYITIHMYKYDCVLFWKENADLQSCLVYNTNLWKSRKGREVP